MTREIDIESPEVQEFLQLLAEILAEKFIEEQRGEVTMPDDKTPEVERAEVINP